MRLIVSWFYAGLFFIEKLFARRNFPATERIELSTVSLKDGFNIAVGPGVEAERLQVAAIYDECFGDGSDELFSIWKASSATCYRMISCDGPIVGYAFYRHTRLGIGAHVVDRTWLYSIAIGKSQQGRGLGAKLLDCSLRDLEKRFGVGQVYLIVDLSNPARGLYKSRGFDELISFRRNDETRLIMSLELS